MPYSVYRKVHMDGLATGAEEIPGPGAYDLKTMISANSRKYSIRGKLQDADAATRNNPPPNCYNPNWTPAEQDRFNAITFGIGGRANVNGRILETPGPGTYKLPSPFDKFKRLPYMSNTQRSFFEKRGKRGHSQKIRKPKVMSEQGREEEEENQREETEER